MRVNSLRLCRVASSCLLLALITLSLPTRSLQTDHQNVKTKRMDPLSHLLDSVETGTQDLKHYMWGHLDPEAQSLDALFSSATSRSQPAAPHPDQMASQEADRTFATASGNPSFLDAHGSSTGTSHAGPSTSQYRDPASSQFGGGLGHQHGLHGQPFDSAHGLMRHGNWQGEGEVDTQYGLTLPHHTLGRDWNEEPSASTVAAQRGDLDAAAPPGILRPTASHPHQLSLSRGQAEEDLERKGRLLLQNLEVMTKAVTIGSLRKPLPITIANPNFQSWLADVYTQRIQRVTDDTLRERYLSFKFTFTQETRTVSTLSNRFRQWWDRLISRQSEHVEVQESDPLHPRKKLWKSPIESGDVRGIFDDNKLPFNAFEFEGYTVQINSGLSWQSVGLRKQSCFVVGVPSVADRPWIAFGKITFEQQTA